MVHSVSCTRTAPDWASVIGVGGVGGEGPGDSGTEALIISAE